MKRTFEEIDYAIRNKLFTPPKPIEVPDAKAKLRIAELDSEGRLIIMKKDDGHGHIGVIGLKPDILSLYTLGFLDVTTKHPLIVSELLSVKFPEETILCSEITCLVNGKQDRNQLTSINRAKDEKAITYPTRTGIFPKMSIFNTLMWNGEDTTAWTNYDRYMQVVEYFKKKSKTFDYVHVTELVLGSLADARIRAQESKWEGMVLYDPDATTEIFINKGDDIPRPDGCWKDKDHFEGDFVAFAYEPSTAKSHPGAVRDFWIGLLDKKTGLVIPMGKCGGGMKKSERIKYANPDLYPLPIEVRYENMSKHGKLVHPRFRRVRDESDKKWQQCIATPEQLKHELAKTVHRIDPLNTERIILRGKKPKYIK
ncbi:MAG: hypothetical protein WCG20_01720 [bacterium]